MEERHIEVSRTARYVVLGGGGPAGPAGPAGPGEVWFVCHGYGQLARDFARPFRDVAGPDRLVVAPEGLSRFYVDAARGRHGPDHGVGATWMTREDREMEIRDYVAYLDRLAERVLAGRGTPDVRVLVLGFSQGVHTACRWACLGRVRPIRLVLWGASLPPDLPADAGARLRDAGVTLVRGQADPHHGPEAVEADSARLRELGVPFQRLTHAGGHRLSRELLGRLASGG